jgi:hypothetical protein
MLLSIITIAYVNKEKMIEITSKRAHRDGKESNIW